MQGIRPQGLTNRELAQRIENDDVRSVSREDLEHVALRFIEIFRHGRGEDPDYVANRVTRTPVLYS
jgi:hypothetical protein